MPELEKVSRNVRFTGNGRLPSAPLVMPEQILTRPRRTVLLRPLFDWLAWR